MAEDTDARRDELRRVVFRRRRALAPEQLAQAGRSFAQAIAATPEFVRAETIGAYWPVRGEMDVHATIDSARAAGKRVHLPVIVAGDALRYAPWQPGMAMRDNRFGIPEPAVAADALISPHELDLAIVPLVVFDDAGHRLGMGGGFYDRSFAFLRETTAERPCLLGAAHEFQHTAVVPHQPWDVPLALVVTDQGVRRPNPNARQDEPA